MLHSGPVATSDPQFGILARERVSAEDTRAHAGRDGWPSRGKSSLIAGRPDLAIYGRLAVGVSQAMQSPVCVVATWTRF